jgi:iron complex transport system substrate-binding protein
VLENVSHEGTKSTKDTKPVVDVEILARKAIERGLFVHRELGPGLLESVYEAVMATGLAREGFRVERQKLVAMQFEDITYPESFRLDLVVNGTLIIELKSTERNLPVYSKQLLTYLKLTEQPVGLLMNFGYPTFREGLKRVVNGPADFKSVKA